MVDKTGKMPALGEFTLCHNLTLDLPPELCISAVHLIQWWCGLKYKQAVGVEGGMSGFLTQPLSWQSLMVNIFLSSILGAKPWAEFLSIGRCYYYSILRGDAIISPIYTTSKWLCWNVNPGISDSRNSTDPLGNLLAILSCTPFGHFFDRPLPDCRFLPALDRDHVFCSSLYSRHPTRA